MKFEEIEEGAVYGENYQLSPLVYEGFLKIFKDSNPLHVDENYAKLHGFEHVVMHGAILNGFLSHFVGMSFPGHSAFLLSVDMRYLKPSYLEDQLKLQATVKQKTDVQQVLVLDFSFHNLNQGCDVARGRAQIMMRKEK